MKEPSVTGAGGGKERFRLGLSDGVRATSRTHGARGLESGRLQFHQSGPLALSALGVPSSLWNHSQGNVSRQSPASSCDHPGQPSRRKGLPPRALLPGQGVGRERAPRVTERGGQPEDSAERAWLERAQSGCGG